MRIVVMGSTATEMRLALVVPARTVQEPALWDTFVMRCKIPACNATMTAHVMLARTATVARTTALVVPHQNHVVMAYARLGTEARIVCHALRIVTVFKMESPVIVSAVAMEA